MFNLYNYTVCQVIDYYFDRKTLVPFIKHSNLVPGIPQESQLPSVVVDPLST